MKMDFAEMVERATSGSMEGSSGLGKLEKLAAALGYERHGFRHGELIEVFLSDNPGAVEALVNWVMEQNVPEWQESLEAEYGQDEDDSED